jgi:hypothetical protein
MLLLQQNMLDFKYRILFLQIAKTENPNFILHFKQLLLLLIIAVHHIIDH